MSSGGTGVDRRGCQSLDLSEEVRFGVVGQVVGFGDGEGWVDGGVHFGAKSVADPADPSSMPPTLMTALVAWSTRTGSTASINRAPT